MATVNQINANRRNAQKSTGPSTLEGKQRASMNALKSGIFAESEIIPCEDAAALTQLRSEYYDHHQPASPEARDLLDSLARNAWLLRRLTAAEASIFAPYPNHPVSITINNYYDRLELIQRRINATERNFHRSLKALQTLESQPVPPAVSAAADFPANPEPTSLDPIEPTDPTPASTNLASFPRSVSDAALREPSAPSPDLPKESAPATPANHPPNLASFRETPETPQAPNPELRIA